MIVKLLRSLLNRERIARSLAAPVVNPRCTAFEVNNRLLSTFVVDVLVPIVDVHPFPVNELLLMSAALCRIHPKHLFEWGTNIGKSARVFYETSKRFGIDTIIHSIDLPEAISHVEHPGKRRGELVRKIREVKLYEGDGLDVAMKLGRSLADQEPFLFFLDGDHRYESVVRELSGIVDTFPASSMLVHDTFYQSPEANYNIGPHEAIEFVLRSRSDFYSTISTTTGLPGMTLLYRSKA